MVPSLLGVYLRLLVRDSVCHCEPVLRGAALNSSQCATEGILFSAPLHVFTTVRYCAQQRSHTSKEINPYVGSQANEEDLEDLSFHTPRLHRTSSSSLVYNILCKT